MRLLGVALQESDDNFHNSQKLLFFNAIYELEETLQFPITFNVHCFSNLGRLQGLEQHQCESRGDEPPRTDVSQGCVPSNLEQFNTHLYKDRTWEQAIIS